jgi:hypothetical protein
MIYLVGVLVILPLISAFALNQNDLGSSILSKRAQVCGTHGYNKATNAYFDQKSTSLSTVEACGAHCLADQKCSSFAIGDGECLHYTVAV